MPRPSVPFQGMGASPWRGDPFIKSNQIKSNQIKIKSNQNRIKSNQIESNQNQFWSNQFKSKSNQIKYVTAWQESHPKVKKSESHNWKSACIHTFPSGGRITRNAISFFCQIRGTESKIAFAFGAKQNWMAVTPNSQTVTVPAPGLSSSAALDWRITLSSRARPAVVLFVMSPSRTKNWRSEKMSSTTVVYLMQCILIACKNTGKLL